MDHGTWDCSLESDGTGANVMSLETAEALHTGLGKNPGGGGRQRMFIHWNRSIKDIMRSHISRWIVETVKEAYTQADRQYDRVTMHEVRALSYGKPFGFLFIISRYRNYFPISGIRIPDIGK